MGILSIKRLLEPRIDPDAVELALDLKPEAVTLFERAPDGDWKKFATAQLDDPEFPIVIGLLRTEAESYTGGRRPVRLWLPREQVLKQRTRLDGDTVAARRKATFDYIDRETVYRPDDVAVAISPPDQNGESTLLITFAETWREARHYATRWGFLPGAVSTRHNSNDFGAEGPVFQLKSPPPEPAAAVNRKRLAIAALVLILIAVGSAIWASRPWETRPGQPVLAPGAAVEVAEAAPIDLTTAPGPKAPTAAIPSERSAPPLQTPRILALIPPSQTDGPPAFPAPLSVAEVPANPDAPVAPTDLGIAPMPLPDPEPAPLERDSVTAWIGPVPEIQPGNISAPLAGKDLYEVMDPMVPAKKVTLLSYGKTPPQRPPTVPKPQQAPTEPDSPEEFPAPEKDPAEVSISAVAPLKVPAPSPRPRRADPADHGAGAVETNPLANNLPPPRPARPVIPDTRTETKPAPPVIPVTTFEIPAAVTPIDPPTKYASLTSPVPKKRSTRARAPRAQPSAAILPAITGSAKGTIRAAATEQGLPLEETALIGILNLDTGRKALIRLPNGRYRSVIVGDLVDGWKVSIIGTDAMRVTRGGKEITLLLVTR